MVHADDFAAKSTDIPAPHTAATSRLGTGTATTKRQEQEQEQHDKPLAVLPVVLLHANSGNRTVKGMWKMENVIKCAN